MGPPRWLPEGAPRVSITEQGSWDVPGLPEPPRDSVGDDWGDGPAAYEPGERPSRPGDRTPPQDNAAEQSVLGSMLLSKDSIADVSEVLRGADFYRPVHEVIFDAIIDLYGRGEPADPITVANELQRRGELARIGGAPYLHTLSANVPIAANAGYYAERSEEHTSELQSQFHLVCRLLLEKKKKNNTNFKQLLYKLIVSFNQRP